MEETIKAAGNFSKAKGNISTSTSNEYLRPHLYGFSKVGNSNLSWSGFTIRLHFHPLVATSSPATKTNHIKHWTPRKGPQTRDVDNHNRMEVRLR